MYLATPMGFALNLNLSSILVGSGQKRGKFTPSKSSNCNFHFWNGVCNRAISILKWGKLLSICTVPYPTDIGPNSVHEPEKNTYKKFKMVTPILIMGQLISILISGKFLAIVLILVKICTV